MKVVSTIYIHLTLKYLFILTLQYVQKFASIPASIQEDIFTLYIYIRGIYSSQLNYISRTFG